MVKVEPICAACLLHRGYEEIELSTKDRDLKMKAVMELLKILSEKFSPEAIPAWLGAERDRVVRRIVGHKDPYSEIKRKSNQEALKLIPKARKILELVKDERERLRKCCAIAAMANAIEIGVLGYKFLTSDLEAILPEAERHLAIDDSHLAFEILKKKGGVLYLLDNAGEAGFDLLLMEELKSMGLKVEAVVKESPVLNDALIEDAVFFGIDKVVDRLSTTGGDEVGLILEKAPTQLLKAYQSADLVIAKGMGNYETLTEYLAKPPVLHVLKAKCTTIAKSLNIPLGSLAVKLRKD